MINECDECYYWSDHTSSCDYYLLTGIRRNPDKLEKCPRYMKGKRISMLSDGFIFGKRCCDKQKYQTNGFYTAMESLYNEGYTDRQIADELGCSYHSVFRWRKKHFLPSQNRREN